MKECINQLIQESILHCEYQSLVHHLNKGTYAFEALTRTSSGINPAILFEYARKGNFTYELDITCIINAIREFPHDFLKEQRLFVNVLPKTVIHSDFIPFLLKVLIDYPWVRNKVVFEVHESFFYHKYWKNSKTLDKLNKIKELGFQIAFDDIPIEDKTFEIIDETRPNFIKLDHRKSRGLSKSIEKQQLITNVLEKTYGKVRIVLEGIEKEADFLSAKQLGVPFMQGYFISFPRRLIYARGK